MLLIALLLAVGTVLAMAGTAGFTVVVWNGPARDDLDYARVMATVGRWAVGGGISALILGQHAVGGVALGGVMVAVVAAVGSLLTKAPLSGVAVS